MSLDIREHLRYHHHHQVVDISNTSQSFVFFCFSFVIKIINAKSTFLTSFKMHNTVLTTGTSWTADI